MTPIELPWLTDNGSKPIAEQVSADLARRIATGEIDAGELLTEVEVAAEYGTSRTPVREAMLRLERWGLIRLLPKKGASVATPTARERRELLAVRTMFESAAVRRIAAETERRDELLDLLSAELDAQAATLQDPAQFAFHDYAFHLRIIDGDGNRIVEELIRSLAPRLYQLTRLAVTTSPLGLEALHREHVELAEAIRRNDPDTFHRLVTTHLDTNHSGYAVGQ